METLLEALIRFYQVELRSPITSGLTVKAGVDTGGKAPNAGDVRRTFPYLP